MCLAGEVRYGKGDRGMSRDRRGRRGEWHGDRLNVSESVSVWERTGILSIYQSKQRLPLSSFYNNRKPLKKLSRYSLLFSNLCSSSLQHSSPSLTPPPFPAPFINHLLLFSDYFCLNNHEKTTLFIPQIICLRDTGCKCVPWDNCAVSLHILRP